MHTMHVVRVRVHTMHVMPHIGQAIYPACMHNDVQVHTVTLDMVSTHPVVSINTLSPDL